MSILRSVGPVRNMAGGRALFAALAVVALVLHDVSGAAIIVNHTSVASFQQIPDSLLPRIAAMRMMLRHASIGDALNQGLDCLQGTRTNPADCSLYPDYRYDRREWIFQNRGNPAWYDKIRDFVTQVEAQQDTFDVMAFKFCFIDYASTPCNAQQRFDSMRVHYEALERQYPLKKFVWWTVPLTRSFGIRCGEDWNNLIRAYVSQNGKILFDLAALESHDTLGNFITDSAGLEMAWQPFCGEQTPGNPSCHPNWTGNLRICRALWVMMARLAGWEGVQTGVRATQEPPRTVECGRLPHGLGDAAVWPLARHNGWRLYDCRGRLLDRGMQLHTGVHIFRSRDGTMTGKVLVAQ